MRGKEKPSQEPTSLGEIGQKLRQVRESQGLGFEEIFAETKISIANLKAIEAQEYQKLPADTFTKGLVSLYGNFLGLDGPAIAVQFFQERNGLDKKAAKSPYITFSESQPFSAKRLAEPSHIPSSTVAVVILSLIIFSFTAFCLYTGWNPFTFITDQTRSLSSSVMETIHPSQATKPEVVETDTLVVEAAFLQDTTVEVSIDGQSASQELYTTGRASVWQADHDIVVTFHQADSATLTLNGVPHPFPAEHNGLYRLHIQTFSPE